MNLYIDAKEITRYRRYNYYNHYAYGYNKESIEKARVTNRNNASNEVWNFMLSHQAIVDRTGGTFTVEKPGFFYYSNMRFKFESFDTIFFPEPGKYSSVSTYKNLRNNGDAFAAGLFGDDERILSMPNFENSALNMCISANQSSPAEVLATEYGKELYEGVLALFEAKEEIEEEDGMVYTFDRYQLILTDQRNLWNVLPDGKLSEFAFPGQDGTAQENVNSFFGLISNQGFRAMNYMRMWSGNRPAADFVVYDPSLEKIVYTDRVVDKAFEFMNDNLDAIVASSQFSEESKSIAGLSLLSPPSKFKEKINNYLANNGFHKFNVTEVFPSMMSSSYSYHNWETKSYKNVQTDDPGYFLVINYGDKRVIGPGCSNNFIHVKEVGDEIRLVHSAWCQHITAWSGGVTDQRYDCWEISDWLSGPFAEKAKISVDEAPILFSGNKLTKEKKRSALDNLRARLDSVAAR